MLKYKIRKLSFKVFANTYNLLNKLIGKKVSYDDIIVAFFRFLKVFVKNYYYKIGDDRVYYNPMRSGVGWVAYFNKSFEQDELNQCKKLIKSDDVIIDIGANIGSHSLYFSSLAPRGIVYSIEPSRITFEYLLKNIKYKENIIPLSLAISNTNEILNFYECDNDVMSGLKDTNRSNVSYINKIPAVQMDNLCSVLNIQKLDFVKIDVEGLETEVIQGFTQVLKKYKPVIFCEIYSGENSNPDSNKTIDLITSLGYKAHILVEDKLVPFTKHDDRYHNYFFINE